MANTWNERERALEEGYFRQKDNELIARMRTNIAGETGTYNCPKCGGKWHTGNFESVQIDVCEGCGGVWLDAGELQQITNREENSGFFKRLFS